MLLHLELHLLYLHLLLLHLLLLLLHLLLLLLQYFSIPLERIHELLGALLKNPHLCMKGFSPLKYDPIHLVLIFFFFGE